MSLAEQYKHARVNDAPDGAPSLGDTDNPDYGLSPESFRSGQLSGLNEEFSWRTPAIDMFDAVTAIDDTIEHGDDFAYSAVTGETFDLEAARQLGDYLYPGNRLLTDQQRLDKEVVAGFTSLTAKADVYVYAGAQWVGRLEAQVEGLDGPQLAVEAAAEARRALELDAELRERGWTDKDIPGYQPFDADAIGAIPVEATPAAEPVTAGAAGSSLVPLIGDWQTRLAARQATRVHLPPETVKEAYGHADKQAQMAVAIANSRLAEATAPLREDSQQGMEAPAATEELTAESAETYDEKLVRIGNEVMAKYHKPTTSEKIGAAIAPPRLRAAVGYAAIKLMNPIGLLKDGAKLVGKGVKRGSELADALDPTARRRTVAGRAILGAAALGGAFLGVRYGYDPHAFTAAGADLSNLIPSMPPGLRGGSGSGHAAVEAHMSLRTGTPVPVQDFLQTPAPLPPVAHEVIQTPVRPSVIVEHFNRAGHTGYLEGEATRALEASGVDVSGLTHGEYQQAIHNLTSDTRVLNGLSWEQANHLYRGQPLELLTPEEIAAAVARVKSAN